MQNRDRSTSFKMSGSDLSVLCWHISVGRCRTSKLSINTSGNLQRLFVTNSLSIVVNMKVDPEKIKTFKTAAKFREWLARNHEVEREIWIKVFKKDTGVASIDWDGCVTEALAWGWIDGVRKSCDELSWYQRLTPRRNKSAWSQRNRAIAEQLIKQNKMQPAGLLEIEAARSDGRWEAAYAGSANFEIPEDFLKVLSRNKKALTMFKSLNRRNLFTIYHRLHTAKKQETRQNRMDKIIETLARGEKFH